MRAAAPPPDFQELRLPAGCLLCGGDLVLRLGQGAARSFCLSCHWISRPHVDRRADGAHVVHHPAGGLA